MYEQLKHLQNVITFSLSISFILTLLEYKPSVIWTVHYDRLNTDYVQVKKELKAGPTQ